MGKHGIVGNDRMGMKARNLAGNACMPNGISDLSR